uniref:Uncharacterized protein n=1 Tax=Populus trichocarpa x Populus deltoides TaxID=3695 RepID=A9PJY1_9ROSI|nr:unknown [Populus trichocarpa x Populus deltoides]
MWLHKYEHHFSFLMQPTIHGRYETSWHRVLLIPLASGRAAS